MTGIASSGRKPVSGRFSLRSDSFTDTVCNIQQDAKAGNLRVSSTLPLIDFDCMEIFWDFVHLCAHTNFYTPGLNLT
jgi:hypothetical protein